MGINDIDWGDILSQLAIASMLESIPEVKGKDNVPGLVITEVINGEPVRKVSEKAINMIKSIAESGDDLDLSEKDLIRVMKSIPELRKLIDTQGYEETKNIINMARQQLEDGADKVFIMDQDTVKNTVESMTEQERETFQAFETPEEAAEFTLKIAMKLHESKPEPWANEIIDKVNRRN